MFIQIIEAFVNLGPKDVKSKTCHLSERRCSFSDNRHFSDLFLGSRVTFEN